MSRKQAPDASIPYATGPDGDPWDSATILDLAASKMIGLSITHIERRFRTGTGVPRNLDGAKVEFIVTGFLTAARQHVHVEITFDPMLSKAGEAFLTHNDGIDYGPISIALPLLMIRLHDPDGDFRSGIAKALDDAVAAGESVAEARLFPAPWPEGWGKREKHSSLSFDIDGVLVWANKRSPRLSKWAYPLGEKLDDYPSPHLLRRAISRHKRS